MGKLKITFNNEGFKQILFSGGTYNTIKEQAQRISDNAGDDFSYDIVKGYRGTRWIAFVHGDTYEANKEEAENKVLSRAVL